MLADSDLVDLARADFQAVLKQNPHDPVALHHLAQMEFQERNIPAERLVASGHAFHRPLAPNTTPEGRAQNRRIEISLVPPPVPEDRPAQR